MRADTRSALFFLCVLHLLFHDCDFRFHRFYQLCQLFFTFFSCFRVDIVAFPLAVGIGWCVTMDAGYKTPWIAKKTIEGSKIPILPYTRYTGKKDRYKPWEYTYDPANDTYICPRGGILRHTTTDWEGKRTYRSIPAQCRACPCKAKCGANEKGQKVHTTHIWQEYLDLVEQIRKTDRAKEIYAQRKETIERVFADAKRYTHHRGLAAVTRWVRLKFAAMNLKKLANWSWKNSFSRFIFVYCFPNCKKSPAFVT